MLSVLSIKVLVWVNLLVGSLILLSLAMQRPHHLLMGRCKLVLGLANFFSGLAVILFFFVPTLLIFKIVLLAWKIYLIVVSRTNWGNRYLIPSSYLVPGILGLLVTYCLGQEFLW